MGCHLVAESLQSCLKATTMHKLLHNQREEWAATQTFQVETGLWRWNVVYLLAYRNKTATGSLSVLKWIFICVPGTFPSPRHTAHDPWDGKKSRVPMCLNVVCHAGLLCERIFRIWSHCNLQFLKKVAAVQICNKKYYFHVTRKTIALSSGNFW